MFSTNLSFMNISYTKIIFQISFCQKLLLAIFRYYIRNFANNNFVSRNLTQSATIFSKYNTFCGGAKRQILRAKKNENT